MDRIGNPTFELIGRKKLMHSIRSMTKAKPSQICSIEGSRNFALNVSLRAYPHPASIAAVAMNRRKIIARSTGKE